jgi:hypothetical protein
VRLRWRHRLGPVQIAGRLGVPASTVHAVLVRCRINRLSRIDRVTGEPLRRFEHDPPGSLIHVNVTRFANIPAGGGHRFVGRQQGYRNQLATPGLTRGKDYKPRIGKAFLHTVIDDHFRLAYVEICTDERAATAAAVLQRAVAWFTDHSVTVERVLSDNGSCYPSHAWRTPAQHSASPTNQPGPTGHKPTARSNASTAPWPTPGSTTQPTNATQPCPTGSTPTITTDPTPSSEANHPSAD